MAPVPMLQNWRKVKNKKPDFQDPHWRSDVVPDMQESLAHQYSRHAAGKLW